MTEVGPPDQARPAEQDHGEPREPDDRPAGEARRRSGIPRIAVELAAWLPGRVGEVTAGTLVRLRSIRFIGLSGELAFFLLLGLLPLVVAVVALVGLMTPLLGRETAFLLEAEVSAFIELQLGGDAQRRATRALEQLLAGRVGLVVGPLVVAIYVAGRGFVGATRALAYLHGRDIRNPYWRDMAVTISFTAAAGLLGVLALVGVLVSPLSRSPLVAVYAWARWIVVPGGMIVFFTALFRYARGGGGSLTRDLPGAVVTTVAIVGSALAYVAYVRTSPELGMGPFIGPLLGVAVATLTLVFAVAAFVLVGGAFNAHLAGDAIEIGPDARR